MKERLTTRVFLDLPYDQYAFWLIQGDMIGSHITMETKQPYITYEPLFRIKKSEAQTKIAFFIIPVCPRAETTHIFIPGFSLHIVYIVSIPLISGMVMSIVIRSGRSCLAI